MDDGLKTRDIEYLNTETWLLLPPINISGYVPAHAWLRAHAASGGSTPGVWGAVK